MMPNLLRCVVFASLVACSGWTPVHNASDIPAGHVVKLETSSGEVVVTRVVVCDREGFVVARSSEDCTTSPFDLRKADVFVHKALVTTDLGIVSVVVLTLVVVSVILMATEN
jgi:hypothetical protein